MTKTLSPTPHAWLTTSLSSRADRLAERLGKLSADPDLVIRWTGILRTWARTTQFDALPDWMQRAGGLPSALTDRILEAVTTSSAAAPSWRSSGQGDDLRPLEPHLLAWLTLGLSGMPESERLAHPLHAAAVQQLRASLAASSTSVSGKKTRPSASEPLADIQRGSWEPAGFDVSEVIALVRAFPTQVPADVEAIALARVAPRRSGHVLLTPFEFQDFATTWNHRGEDRLRPGLMATLRWLSRGSAEARATIAERVDAHLAPPSSSPLHRGASRRLDRSELLAQLVELRLRVSEPGEALPSSVTNHLTADGLSDLFSAFRYRSGGEHRMTGLIVGLLQHPERLSQVLKQRTAPGAAPAPGRAARRSSADLVSDDLRAFDQRLANQPDLRLSLDRLPPQGLAFLLKHREWPALYSEAVRQLGTHAPAPIPTTPPGAGAQRPKLPGR